MSRVIGVEVAARGFVEEVIGDHAGPDIRYARVAERYLMEFLASRRRKCTHIP
jgi:hypothetical protein